MKTLKLALLSYYFTWGVILPLIFIFILSFSTVYQILSVSSKNTPLSEEEISQALSLSLPLLDPTRASYPKAYLFLPLSGASSSEVLLTSAFFHQTEIANALPIALEKKIIPLTSGLDLYVPHHLQDIKLQPGDTLVLFSSIGPHLPEEAQWLKNNLSLPDINYISIGQGIETLIQHIPAEPLKLVEPLSLEKKQRERTLIFTGCKKHHFIGQSLTLLYKMDLYSSLF